MRSNVLCGLANYLNFGIGDDFSLASNSIILWSRSSIAFFSAASSCIICNLLLLTKKRRAQVAQHLFPMREDLLVFVVRDEPGESAGVNDADELVKILYKAQIAQGARGVVGDFEDMIGGVVRSHAVKALGG